MYEKTKKKYKPFLLEVKGAGHNDIEHDQEFRKEYFKKIREFVIFLKENKNALEKEYEENIANKL